MRSVFQLKQISAFQIFICVPICTFVTWDNLNNETNEDVLCI